jgi:hypothetical protein
MKQSLIQEHFPSKKPVEGKLQELDATARKRKCTDSPSPVLYPAKKPVFSLTPRPDPAESNVIRSLLPALEESQSRTDKVKELLTDIKRPPQLSDKTQKLLSELNQRRPARPTPTVDEILSSVSAKEKYQGLLVPERELCLPYDYKRLLTLFETCDLIVNFMKRRRTECCFGEVRKAVEEQTKLKFVESNLQQFLTVVPEAYVLRWVKAMGREFTLILDFPEREEKAEGLLTTTGLERRKSLFKAELLNITKQHHEAFLRTLPSRPQINPDRLRCWFHGFDVHSVPSVPISDLPPKPTDENVQTVKEFLKFHCARNKMVQNVLEEIPSNAQPDPVEQAMDNKSLLSSAVLAKLRSQDQLYLEDQTVPGQLQRESRRNNLIALCEMLKAMFATHRTPSMFLEAIVSKVRMGRKLDCGEAEVEALIKEVVDILPNWLTIIQTSMGAVLRIERRIDMLQTTVQSEVLKRYS